MRTSTVKRLQSLALRLVNGQDLASALIEEGISAGMAARILRGKRGQRVMNNVRKLIAFRQFGRLKASQAQTLETCRQADTEPPRPHKSAPTLPPQPAPPEDDNFNLDEAIAQAAHRRMAQNAQQKPEPEA